MSRLLALLQKEAAQHGWLLAGLSGLLALIWLLLVLGTAVGPRTITVLEAHAAFVRVFVPLLGLALGRRLVVGEYHARTQRFLEALPVRRSEVVAVKWLIGAALLALPAAASLLATTAVAALRQPVDARWIAIVFVRTEGFTLALWSFFFTMGLLGRWRFPLYLSLVVFVALLDRVTGFEVARFGPFALVGDTFVLERLALPLEPLAVSAALAAGLLALGAALALLNEGSVAEAMARRMSRRDKAAVGVALVAAVIVSELADERPDAPPFAFEGEVVRRDGVEVLLLEEGDRPAAEALARAVSGDLRALAGALDAPRLPSVHIALRSSLEPREIERGDLDEEEDGVLVRAAYTHPDFDAGALRVFTLERVMERATDDRAAFEPNAWVRSGLAAQLADPGSPRALARARWLGRRRRPSFGILARWHRTEERFGPAIAGAAAALAVDVIVQRAGRPSALAFARAVIGAEPPAPLLALLRARLDPVEARLREHTGLGARELEAAWRARLAGAPPLASPRVSAELAIEPLEGDLRAIRWSARGAPPAARCALVHAPLGPFDLPLERDALTREERPCAAVAGDGEAMIGRYGAGERVLLAIEVEDDALGAWVRLRAERRTLP